METNYKWSMKGLAKGIDPSLAAEELRRIQNVYGRITPEIIVNESKEPQSILHPIFEWDNKKAAFNYRLQQARILLNNIKLSVIADGETKEISVYEVTSLQEGYKSIETLTPDDIEYIKKMTSQQLTYLKDKLKTYKEFDKVRYFIEQAIEVIN